MQRGQETFCVWVWVWVWVFKKQQAKGLPTSWLLSTKILAPVSCFLALGSRLQINNCLSHPQYLEDKLYRYDLHNYH